MDSGTTAFIDRTDNRTSPSNPDSNPPTDHMPAPQHNHHSSPLPQSEEDPNAHDNQPDNSEDESSSDLDSTPAMTTGKRPQRKKRKRDVISTLPAPILQQILAYLPPFQMLTISELSRKFYTFVVLGQEMNEVWFRLVKHEEAQQKKQLDYFRAKRLEQEHRSVQMMRSFSNSSTGSTSSDYGYAGGGGYESPSSLLSKQQLRQLHKKQEAAGKSPLLNSTGTMGAAPPKSSLKVMKRSDRKKNWCKVYVDTILRGNGEDLLEPLSSMSLGPAKKPAKFQTVVLNDSLASEHLKEYRKDNGAQHGNEENVSVKESREAKTQAKVEARAYYKMIRSKPKGKKPGQVDSPAAKLDKIAHWREPEWVDDLAL
ncbi:hypothetical protein BGW38_005761 [Lunasporangiospora selenospora]|uniref:F-box domain-containing protein n=1 Tax=Lunasporangiospora selenospora TaxID=979761 RepID=A0A9P6FZV2_9FUNG|nr:hypothetical protein BGW38_005761 [Lunasporangiospora selenospora]